MNLVPAPFTCRLCGAAHAPVRLRRGQRAHCIRCGSTLARQPWLGPEAPAALACTGAILAVPALVLPFASVNQLGHERTVRLLDSAGALWREELPWLAVWVALAGALLPVLMLCILAAVGLRRRAPSAGRVRALAEAVAPWAMPEVLVLAVLVALIRLSVLADVALRPGFWCYAGVAGAAVLAWRGYLLDPGQRPRPAEVRQ